MSEYLVIDKLTKIYPTPKGPAVIVRDFNLRIKKGEFVCLIGHSGCGKSTVLSIVAGLNEITEGGIILAGKELVGPGPDRGVVFQSPCLLPWLTAFENVMLGVDQVFYTTSNEERRQIAEYYLSVVGLADAMHKKPAELSQGMRQRVGIARAFALSPKMLLLDEPFGMLDSLTRMELQQVLIELWRKDKKTALMVTHDVDEALFLADRIVMMTNGPEAEVGDILEVNFPRPRERKAVLEHPDYYKLREHLITFLEEFAHKKHEDKNHTASSTKNPPEKFQPKPEVHQPESAESKTEIPSEIKPMTKTAQTLLTSAILLCATNEIFAQYAPPPPPLPFQGFLNEYLRKDDPYMNKWDFGGSVRARYEAKENFAVPGVAGAVDFRKQGVDTDNEYFTEKIRFRAAYTDKWFGVFAEGRNSFVQSDERFAATAPVRKRGQGPESDTIDLHQAYFTLGNHKEFPLSLKVGRQELSYGEERLVGAFAWNNIGRVFDAAKIRWQNEWFGADFFSSRVVIPEDQLFNVANDYDYFSGFYANSSKVPKNNLEFYFLSRNADDKALSAEPHPQFPQPSARDIYTVGLRLKSLPKEFGNWDYALEAMGQFGHFNDTRAGVPIDSQEHQAYAVVLQAGYTFADCFGTPRIGLEYSHASGDSDPTDDKHETFENLFPTNHKFYGYMDFVSLQNIHDIRAIYQIKPHSRLSLALEGHAFWLANTHDNFYNVGGAPRGGGGTSATTYAVNPSYNNYVGSEIDLIAGFAVTRFAQLEAGYGHFFVGDYVKSSLKGSGGAGDADFFYAQFTMNF